MELPSYRLPQTRNILLQMWLKNKIFLYKAETIIFFGWLFAVTVYQIGDLL